MTERNVLKQTCCDAPQWVFFTDLDGTLLDHHNYNWAPALPALRALEARGLPLVINSSKTAAEIRALRVQLDNHHPYIVENGAAVVVPENYFAPGPERVVTTAATREALLTVLHRLRAEGFRFTGFSDLSVTGLAQLTGLDEAAAALAADRKATEPLLWEGDDQELSDFRRALACHGLQLLEGGRFLHVMGQFDKADGLRYLMSQWRRLPGGDGVRSVALGDGPNDRDMLAGADLAVIIQGVNSDRIDWPPARPVIRSREPGPVGWNTCVLEILEGRYDTDRAR